MRIGDGGLSNEVRRDFTFIHPEFFLDDKYQIEKGTLKLKNSENFQEYKVMFLTGCNIISHKTLEKLRAFYESGATIISTTQLPFKSSEPGEDQKVIDIITEIFGVSPLTQMPASALQNGNDAGGVLCG